jgi:hypothetical protein
MRAHADVPTLNARRYMAQLCKHWSHKYPVELSETDGRITLAAGTCMLHAGEEALTIDVEAADEPTVRRLEDVVANHVARFAFREELHFDWKAEVESE